ncbi:MAG: class II SORL domain-containing protein [Halobacteriota archaeon]|nr:class II SORL domain-containing protein [Halobacteriota archaeon]
MGFKDLINPPEKEGKEKHVPVIEAQGKAKKGEWIEVSVVVGKEVAHPNTLEHHIEGISLYFKEDGEKPVYKVADFTSFAVHTDSCVSLRIRVEGSGSLHALSSCNIHGLWESEKRIEVE